MVLPILRVYCTVDMGAIPDPDHTASPTPTLALHSCLLKYQYLPIIHYDFSSAYSQSASRGREMACRRMACEDQDEVQAAIVAADYSPQPLLLQRPSGNVLELCHTISQNVYYDIAHVF
jgi:hypothetical protein